MASLQDQLFPGLERRVTVQSFSTVQPFFQAVKMKGADGEYGEHAGRTARCTAPTFVGGILEPDLMSVSNDKGWSVFAAALSTSGFDLILSPPTKCQVRLASEQI